MNLDKLKTCIAEIDDDKLDVLKNIILKYNDIIILGNGGSNAISCHISQDYTKVLGKRALCFGDSSRLTCYANDYGWDNTYLQFLKEFSNENTLVILISSSGESNNILKCAYFCTQNNRDMITLSGFSEDNRLNKMFGHNSLIHFWVDSTDYGIVECTHEIILHSVI